MNDSKKIIKFIKVEPKFLEVHPVPKYNNFQYLTKKDSLDNEFLSSNRILSNENKKENLKEQKKTFLRKNFRIINITLLSCNSFMIFLSIITLIVFLVLFFNSKPFRVFQLKKNLTEFENCNRKLNYGIFSEKKEW